MYHSDFYINRLATEWLSHEKIIIACDIDDTIIPYNLELTSSCGETIDLLLDCQKEGVVLILNTARQKERLSDSVSEVKSLGLSPISINEMPTFVDIPFGKSGKVYANIYLDDRGGLELARKQLKKALELVRQEREQQKLKTDI